MDNVQRSTKAWAWPLALVLLPLLVKLHLLLGIYQASPALFYAGLSQGLAVGHSAYPSIDFNNGAVSQALGRRAALDVLSGVMPWWNPYEGVGTPLLGEMQSAALFPGTWLLALPGGQLAMQTGLQVVAGVFTYLTMRRLGLAALACTTAGILFEFNGTYAWLINAVMNPIAFLPVMLFGIEQMRVGASGGWRWVAAGLALSLYAGFPEVAYIDGLLAGVWALARLPGRGEPARRYFLPGLAGSALCGVLLAAPLLAAFTDYLPHASLILHQQGFFSHVHIPPKYLLNLALPYVLGQIFGVPDFGNIAAFWGKIGGYFGILPVVLGLLGIQGRRLLGLRLCLLAWVLVCGAMVYGGPTFLLRTIPGLSNASFYRYADPAMAMALAVLAALGLDDLMRPEAGTRRYWLAMGGATLLFGIAVLAAWPALAVDQARLWRDLSFGIAGIVFLALFGIGWLRRHKAAALLALATAEAVFNFALPSFNYSRHEHMALGGVAYLKAHLGLQRAFTMGVIRPNYGSYFGIATIDDCDLPVPAAWLAYRQRHLDPGSSPLLFDGTIGATATAPGSAQTLARNLAFYEAVGVKYVAALPGAAPLGGSAPLVYADRAMRIFELPAPRPYFSAPGCVVTQSDRLLATAQCSAPSTLTRLELTMPGWRAWVNGKPAEVTTTSEIFQAVALPAGASSIRFAFRPPHAGLGLLAFLLGCAAFLLPLQQLQRHGAAWRRKGPV